MKFLSLALLAFCLLISAAMAQEATKFDEFGDLDRASIRDRIINFADSLKQTPSARAYIVAYGGRHSGAGDVVRLANWSGQMMLDRGIKRERMTLLNGGFREEPTVELWTAPNRAAAPAFSPLIDPSEVMPRLVSKRVDVISDIPPADDLFHKRLDWLNSELKDNPTATAFLYAYGSKDVKAAEVAKTAATAKRYTAMTGKITVQRVVAKTAPRPSNQARLEIWLVPAESKPPPFETAPASSKAKGKTVTKKKK